jgi:hypothetical protein
MYFAVLYLEDLIGIQTRKIVVSQLEYERNLLWFKSVAVLFGLF